MALFGHESHLPIQRCNQENDIYMRTIKFTSWQDDGLYIGFLNDYPDYLTQGETKEELTDNLKDLLLDLESGEVPYVHKVEELLVA